MIKKSCFLLYFSAFLIFFFYNGALAQSSQEQEASETEDQAKSLQLSLWSKYQLHDSDTSINLLRLNMVYGFNKDVSFLDMGIFGRTSGKFSGWQLNLVNITGGDLRGIQTGIYNSAGDAKSVQIGIINTSKKTLGWQIGLINHAEDMDGMQAGLLYNTAETLKGIQIGLLNMNWSGEPRTFLPIVNLAW